MTAKATTESRSLAALLEEGLAHHRAGRLRDAEAAYRRVLEARPGQPDALHSLGVIAHQSGRHEAAARLIGEAVADRPKAPEFHNNLGLALRALGRTDAARAAFEKAIAVRPDFAPALGNLGLLLKDVGRPAEAEAAIRRAIELDPGFAEGHVNLGLLRQLVDDWAGAADAFRRALALREALPEAHNGLGHSLHKLGHVRDAVAHYRKAIELRPNYADALYNLARALKQIGELDAALATYRRLLAHTPDHVDAWSDLGNTLRLRNQADEAVAAYRRALELDPEHANALNNLGNTYKEAGMLESAVACYRRAIAAYPDYAEAHNNLSMVLHQQCAHDEAAAMYRRSMELSPTSHLTHSNFLLFMHYTGGYGDDEVFAEHRRWGERHGRRLAAAIRPHANDRDPDRRLRVGYVSPDFRSHSVAYFCEALLAARDPDRVETVCYSHGAAADATTRRLRSLADGWCDIFGMSDGEAHERIRGDGVDILVDLAGHTGNNRLVLFARKPAPVQASYIGYCDTTGLETIDYRITDARADPEGREAFHSERLVRLPDCFLCYTPPGGAPEPAPRERDVPITFGSFNNSSKVTAETVALWSRILAAVPDSRLLLKAQAFHDAATRERFADRFAANGVARERVELIGRVPSNSAHLGLYRRVDVALDTFPYNGTTTTCEALWMGVPVVTLAGARHAGRVGVSLLTTVGLDDLIADDEAAYVELAAGLAGDAGRRAELRATLRRRMAESPLCDRTRFARAIEDAYRAMWRRWCAGS